MVCLTDSQLPVLQTNFSLELQKIFTSEQLEGINYMKLQNEITTLTAASEQ